MKSGPRSWRVLGHPAHVPLTHFPLALWTAAFGADLLYFWREDPFWWRFAFWCIAIGLGIGLLTLATGFLDLTLIPEEKKSAERTAIWHMSVMLAAACLFTLSLYYHRDQLPASPLVQMTALVLSGLGTLCLHFGGWLGGELVYRHGVGYDKDDLSV
jgi:uncharacterized membrane protein